MFLNKARRGSFSSDGILLSSVLVVVVEWWGNREEDVTPLMAYFCLLSCLNLSCQEKT